MASKESTIKYKIEASGLPGVRLALAKALVGVLSLLLKVRARPTIDDRKPTREAEVASNREMIYRGTPVADLTLEPTSYPVHIGNERDKPRSCEICGIGRLTGERRLESYGVTYGYCCVGKDELRNALNEAAKKLRSGNPERRCRCCKAKIIPLTECKLNGEDRWCEDCATSHSPTRFRKDIDGPTGHRGDPGQSCVKCGTPVAALTTYQHNGRSPLCWECFDAALAEPADPSPQGHVRCQVCDYPTFKLAKVAGLEMCGWCAIQASPKSEAV